MAAGETDLICDLAETYGILDYKVLPVSLLAALCAGLGENSRIKRKASGLPVSQEVLLLAAAVDRLSFLVWAKTEDARKGRNRPKSLTAMLYGTKEESEVLSFDTAEEFEMARASILERVK